MRLALGTPVLRWPVWRVIHLPEEKVLFQLDRDQLCLLDIATRRVALWDRGHGPIAITDELLRPRP